MLALLAILILATQNSFGEPVIIKFIPFIPVFCSTENLKSKLILRSQNAEKFHVIDNAYKPTDFYEFSEDMKVNRLDEFFAEGYKITGMSLCKIKQIL